MLSSGESWTRSVPVFLPGTRTLGSYFPEMTSPSTPTTPGQPANQYASRVPTMIQQPPSTQQPHSREDSTRPTIPGLPLQRLPMGALASKVVGPGQPSPGAQSGTNGAAMQRGLIDSMNLKQPPPIAPAPKQKVSLIQIAKNLTPSCYRLMRCLSTCSYR